MEDIDYVLSRLSQVIDGATLSRSRQGYFAAMYRRVTERVKAGITRGDFDDAPRMARFDRLFAEHYFQALDGAVAGKPIVAAWQTAFDATHSQRLLVVQHLLLGMNAHIYLDLGVAAAEVMQGQDYDELRHDFFALNRILLDELNPTQNRVGELSPWVGLLDRFLGPWDEWIAGLALTWFRESAWEFGARLARLEPARWPAAIAERDRVVAELARELLLPHGPARWIAGVVRMRESRDVASNIAVLA